MDNKKYLDKVIGSLVRSTKLDYENGIVSTPLTLHLLPFHLSSSFFLFTSFSKYCKNTFGLTEEEIDYVWDEYKDIMKDKISKREP